MTNPFHSNELLKSVSNYPVKKGDVSGHDFHGNQYVSAGNQAAESQKLRDYVKDTAVRLVDHDAVAEHHRTIARALEETAKPLEGEKGQLGRIRDAYVKAAEAHRFAAGRHIAAFVNPLTGSLSAPGAAKATDDALLASERADDINYANHRDYYLADEGMGGTRP
jgi:hypothetical protein